MLEAATFAEALALALRPENLMWLLIGFGSGIVVGAIPGLVESTFLAIVLPFTIYLDVWSSLFFMVGGYVASEAAGSYPAIVLNMPGTPGTTLTAIEGHRLALKGQAGEAIGVSVLASAVGTAAGALVFLFLGPVAGAFSRSFGSPEVFMLGVFGLSAVASFTGASPVKGIVSVLLGLLIASTGIDLVHGEPRAHFGILELYDALPLLPVLLGLFGFSEVLLLASKGSGAALTAAAPRGLAGPLRGLGIGLRHPMALARSTAIGLVIGIVPGAGGSAAAAISYGQARQWSRWPAEFGAGSYEGLVSTDAANNAVVPGALLPTFIIGVPGSPVAVIVLAALMMQGIRPGPGFYDAHAVHAAAIGVSLLVCAGLLLIVCVPLAGVISRVVAVPLRLLLPIVLVACVAGIFTSRRYLIDVQIMAVFGVLGFFVKRNGYSPVALLLALILGRMLEENLFRSLMVGGPMIFLEKPIAATLLALSVASIVLPPLLAAYRRAEGKRR